MGLSQAELAEKIGVSENIISRYERGINGPKREHLFHLAEILGFSIDALISANNYSNSYSLTSDVAELLEEATPSQRKIVLSTVKTLLSELRKANCEGENNDNS